MRRDYAFPTTKPDAAGYTEQFPGMTLRDYFAAKSMAAYLSDGLTDWDDETLAYAARKAYRAADALLVERQRPECAKEP